jgi:hypothetical protein|tara:strand:+ start:1554 stop:1838 length:285 start_codon:yes stop_codon:yes gene_type:complete
MLTQLIKNLIAAILISKCYCDKIILKRSMSCPIITDKMINSYKKIIIKHKYDNSNEGKNSNMDSSILQKDYSKILNKRVEKIIYLRNRERYNFK